MIPTTPSKPWHCDSQAFLQIGAALQGQGSSKYHIVEAPPKEVQQIAEWYQHHPVPGFTLKKVDIIHNPQMARLFEGRIALLEERHENPAFQPCWAAESQTIAERKQREETLALLEKKAAPFKDPHYPHVTIVPLWHGTKKEILPSLFKTGFANLATTDSGFFGKGIYSAGEAEYAYRVYSQGALLINWVAIYSVFPVLRDDMKSLMGKGNYQNYDGHFIPVVPKDPQNPHEVTYYPCKPGEKHLYTELVVFESSQVLPRYLVELQPELLTSPPGMGQSAAPTSSFTAGELLTILFELLDNPQIQTHVTLCERLQSKVDMLLDLPESTPLGAEDDRLFKLAKRLLTQGKVNNAVLNSLLKQTSTPLNSPSLLVSSPTPSSVPSSNPVASVSSSPVSQIVVPSLPSMAFGAAKWNQYFGDVGVEPPLPSNIDKILSSPCPFWPGKKVEETHLLVLVPQTVNGKPLTLKSLGELVKKPKQGNAIQNQGFYLEDKDFLVSTSHWVLMTRDVIEGSRNKSYVSQKLLVASYAQKTGVPYEVPHILDAAVCILLQYVQSGTRLYSNTPLTYTRCQEKFIDWQLAVGQFSPAGLGVTAPYSDSERIGVGCSRQL